VVSLCTSERTAALLTLLQGLPEADLLLICRPLYQLQAWSWIGSTRLASGSPQSTQSQSCHISGQRDVGGQMRQRHCPKATSWLQETESRSRSYTEPCWWVVKPSAPCWLTVKPSVGLVEGHRKSACPVLPDLHAEGALLISLPATKRDRPIRGSSSARRCHRPGDHGRSCWHHGLHHSLVGPEGRRDRHAPDTQQPAGGWEERSHRAQRGSSRVPCGLLVKPSPLRRHLVGWR